MPARNREDAETIVETVDLISKKWHPVIVRRLADNGPLRFSELKHRVEGISGKVLTDSLEELVENALIKRDVICESPLRVEYDLTACGRDLDRVLVDLLEWRESHLDPTPQPTILIVDGDPGVVRMYTDWLKHEYTIKRSYFGSDALRKLTGDVDLVILDRRMSGLPGTELLDRIDGMNLECRTVVATAVEPDFDIVDMKFDDYLLKPVSEERLKASIDDVLGRDSGNEKIREYRSATRKRALLREAFIEPVLRGNDEYSRIVDRIADLEPEIRGRTGGGMSRSPGTKSLS